MAHNYILQFFQNCLCLIRYRCVEFSCPRIIWANFGKRFFENAKVASLFRWFKVYYTFYSCELIEIIGCNVRKIRWVIPKTFKKLCFPCVLSKLVFVPLKIKNNIPYRIVTGLSTQKLQKGLFSSFIFLCTFDRSSKIFASALNS